MASYFKRHLVLRGISPRPRARHGGPSSSENFIALEPRPSRARVRLLLCRVIEVANIAYREAVQFRIVRVTLTADKAT